LLPHSSRIDLVNTAALMETLDRCDQTMASPWSRIPSWGLGLWSWTSVSETSGRLGFCVEASVAMMVVLSDVKNMALVVLVRSSAWVLGVGCGYWIHEVLGMGGIRCNVWWCSVMPQSSWEVLLCLQHTMVAGSWWCLVRHG
jgi:hypothetical protein